MSSFDYRKHFTRKHYTRVLHRTNKDDTQSNDLHLDQQETKQEVGIVPSKLCLEEKVEGYDEN